MLVADVYWVCNLYVEHPGLVGFNPQSHVIVVSPALSITLILARGELSPPWPWVETQGLLWL